MVMDGDGGRPLNRFDRFLNRYLSIFDGPVTMFRGEHRHRIAFARHRAASASASRPRYRPLDLQMRCSFSDTDSAHRFRSPSMSVVYNQFD